MYRALRVVCTWVVMGTVRIDGRVEGRRCRLHIALRHVSVQRHSDTPVDARCRALCSVLCALHSILRIGDRVRVSVCRVASEDIDMRMHGIAQCPMCSESIAQTEHTLEETREAGLREMREVLGRFYSGRSCMPTQHSWHELRIILTPVGVR